jgi:hypothetical protein
LSWVRFVQAAASAETERIKARTRAALRSIVLLAAAALVLLIGVIFTLVGLYASLVAVLPGWQAGGLIGLGAVLVCVLLVAAARRGSARSSARPAPLRQQSAAEDARRRAADDLQASAELGAAASSAARDFVGRHRPNAFQLALAAFVFGLIASRRPPRRRKDRD